MVIVNLIVVFLSKDYVLLNLLWCFIKVKVILRSLGKNSNVVVFYMVIIIMFWCVIC